MIIRGALEPGFHRALSRSPAVDGYKTHGLGKYQVGQLLGLVPFLPFFHNFEQFRPQPGVDSGFGPKFKIVSDLEQVDIAVVIHIRDTLRRAL